jgi:hypothetical protein
MRPLVLAVAPSRRTARTLTEQRRFKVAVATAQTHALVSLRCLRTNPGRLVGEPSELVQMNLIIKPIVFKKSIPGILFVLAAVMLGVTACSSARINGMQPPESMSRDAERQHIKDEGIEFCKRYPEDVACQRRAQ